jgi:hypothetical protein
MVAIYIFSLYISRKVPLTYDKLIIKNKGLFAKDDIYKKYKEKIYGYFKSKKERYFPLIFGLIYSLGWFYLFGLTRNFEYGGFGYEIVYFEGFTRLLYILHCVLTSLVFVIDGIMILSTFFIIFFAYLGLNKLGSEEFKLDVNYKELKIGSFNNIGKFILTITIPSLLLSTYLSIIGLIAIFIEAYFFGYIYISLGLIFTSFMAFLLYKNTIHIHEAISSFKAGLKLELMDEIQRISSQNIDAHQKYLTITNIHEYYDRVDDIYDWPYNPRSIKKLIVTFSSSVLPFLLSFIGLG